jgi:hypothetical protein
MLIMSQPQCFKLCHNPFMMKVTTARTQIIAQKFSDINYVTTLIMSICQILNYVHLSHPQFCPSCHNHNDVTISVTSQPQWRDNLSDVTASMTSSVYNWFTLISLTASETLILLMAASRCSWSTSFCCCWQIFVWKWFNFLVQFNIC